MSVAAHLLRIRDPATGKRCSSPRGAGRVQVSHPALLAARMHGCWPIQLAAWHAAAGSRSSSRDMHCFFIMSLPSCRQATERRAAGLRDCPLPICGLRHDRVNDGLGAVSWVACMSEWGEHLFMDSPELVICTARSPMPTLCAQQSCSVRVFTQTTLLPLCFDRRYFLAQHTQVEERVCAELDKLGLLATAARPNPRSLKYEDLGKLTFLGCVIKVGFLQTTRMQ